ncbi:hypothetical protein [Labrys wisconsinensis]|uniref:Uncharacterized protein n=1 Tax=Labrys wisconsinensis TaxID=425677 RepID=A0ABU0JGB1_9HYPH|nr:hypothetical protein [Labrys wisconsinensis]MDQ0473336.1 hypothetical protein [Labrys wisconsinensis]
MRKTLLALVLAAGALGAATTASEAHYRSYGGYGYGGYNYGYQQTYYQPSYCRTVSFRVWDDYSCEYVYRTKEICD